MKGSTIAVLLVGYLIYSQTIGPTIGTYNTIINDITHPIDTIRSWF